MKDLYWHLATKELMALVISAAQAAEAFPIAVPSAAMGNIDISANSVTRMSESEWAVKICSQLAAHKVGTLNQGEDFKDYLIAGV